MRSSIIFPNNYPIIEEIKNEYKILRENGNSRNETIKNLVLTYHTELTNGIYDDALLFWIGLAEAQIKTKELSDDVATKALAALDCIEKQQIFSLNEIGYCRSKYQQAPMPEKKIIKTHRFKCTWNIGDTFSIKLTGDVSKKCGMYGKHAVLQKVDTIDFGDGRILPLVRITIWNDLNKPIAPEEFYSKKPIKLKPMYGQTPKFQYCAQILFTSQRQLKHDVFDFLGNFPQIETIPDEIIPNIAGEIVMLSPNSIDSDCCWLYQYSMKMSTQTNYKTGDGLREPF